MIGSLANRSASDGVAVFPNLGYKKDAFLEPSLVSDNFEQLQPSFYNYWGNNPLTFIIVRG